MFQIGGVRQLKNDPFFQGLDFEDVYRLNAGIPPLQAEMLEKREKEIAAATMRANSSSGSSSQRQSPMPNKHSGKTSGCISPVPGSHPITPIKPTPKRGLPPTTNNTNTANATNAISRPQSTAPPHLHSMDLDFDLSCFHAGKL